MNPYKVLGVSETATQEEIKKAYRRAASASHPDRAGGNPDRMREVNIAYQQLTDPRNPHYRKFNMENQPGAHIHQHFVHINMNGHNAEEFLQNMLKAAHDPSDPRAQAAIAMLRIIQIMKIHKMQAEAEKAKAPKNGK